MFKIIKNTAWKTADGREGSTLVLAYKGRVFTVNPGDFDTITIDEKAKLVKFGEKVQIIKDVYHNALGEAKMGLKLMPVMDLEIGEI